MPDLNFEVIGAEAVHFAAVPTINFKLHIANANAEEHIHSVALHCQIRLEVTRRRHSAEAQARLLEVFGEPKRWGETLRSLLWTHVNAGIPQFTGETTIELPVPCTYDFDVVSVKYFNALEDGDIPLIFLFSGTMFYEGEEGNLQVGQISWSKEAAYRLPVAVWKDMMARYFPNTAWIHLHKDVFDQLYQYKAERGLPTWEDVIANLLQASGEEVH
jgi:hypothetical protein